MRCHLARVASDRDEREQMTGCETQLVTASRKADSFSVFIWAILLLESVYALKMTWPCAENSIRVNCRILFRGCHETTSQVLNASRKALACV